VQEVVGIIAILKEQLGYIPDVDTIARERMRRRNKTGGGTAAQADESVEKTRFAVHRESVRAALRVTSFVFSVEELAHASEDDDHRIIDDIADPEDCFARTIEQLCIRQDPRWQKLTALGPLTKAILQLFACDFSFRQIGILLARRFDNQRQVSGERVRQIANKDLIAHGLPPLKLLEHPPRRKVK
jgi:DNA-directed RNA polymerase sigma subunit (sigma70/sigma32)